jgi:hypothetical protein
VETGTNVVLPEVTEYPVTNTCVFVGRTSITVDESEGCWRRLSKVVTRATTPGANPAGEVGVIVPVLVTLGVGVEVPPVGVTVGVAVGKSEPRLSTGSPERPPETPAAACDRAAVPSNQLRAPLTEAPGFAA